MRYVTLASPAKHPIANETTQFRGTVSTRAEHHKPIDELISPDRTAADNPWEEPQQMTLAYMLCGILHRSGAPYSSQNERSDFQKHSGRRRPAVAHRSPACRAK